MAKTLSPYAVLQNFVVHYMEGLGEPSAHQFSFQFIDAANVLSAYGDGMQDAMITLCARALLSRTAEERAAYLSDFEVPGQVFLQLTAPKEWPSFGQTQPVQPELPV